MTNIVDLDAKRRVRKCEREVREYLETVGRSRFSVQFLAERLSPADFERFTNLIRGTGGHFFDAVFGEGEWDSDFWSGDPDDGGPHRCLNCDVLLPDDHADSVCEPCFQEACEIAAEARREMERL